MLIKISNYDGDKHENDLHINLLDKRKHEWLIKHLIWAMSEGMGVQIMRNDQSTDKEDIEKQAAYERMQKDYRTLHGKG